MFIELKNMATGEHGVYEESAEDQWDFNWQEGNYSCDCNRSIFLYRDVLKLDDWEDHCLECNVYENIIEASIAQKD